MTYCNAIESACVCKLESDHEGAHECACGGAWVRTDDSFKIVAWPGDDPDEGFVVGQDAGVPPEERLYA